MSHNTTKSVAEVLTSSDNWPLQYTIKVGQDVQEIPTLLFLQQSHETLQWAEVNMLINCFNKC